jgi:cellulose synthase/poly-beta-1,6-N-acetylglucosamine synthase-like glycosyltransferase
MKKFFKIIKRVAQKIASIIVELLLFLSYFLVITPFALIIKIFKDYLGLKGRAEWKTEKNIEDISTFLKKQ